MAENVDPATRTSDVTDESFAGASVPGADEEAIATGQAGVRAFGEEEKKAASTSKKPCSAATTSRARRKE